MTSGCFEIAKGCLLAALFACGPAVIAHADDPERPDIVACVRAVDGLDAAFRDKMQSHCLVLAGNFCEAPTSGPMLDCLTDVTADMTEFLAHALPRLPGSVDLSPLRSQTYARRLSRLQAGRDHAAHCAAQYARTFDRAICQNVAVFADLTDVFDAARTAGVTLP